MVFGVGTSVGVTGAFGAGFGERVTGAFGDAFGEGDTGVFGVGTFEKTKNSSQTLVITKLQEIITVTCLLKTR